MAKEEKMRHWSHEELQAMIPVAKRRLAEAEAQQPFEVRGLPPLALEECLEYFSGLMDLAAKRPLTPQEVFLHDQLLSQFRQATWAEALGKKGRFYVIPESALEELEREAKQ